MEKHPGSSPRLHRSITGDGINLTERDPADEAIVEAFLESLRCGCEPERRILVGEKGDALHVVCTRCWREALLR